LLEYFIYPNQNVFRRLHQGQGETELGKSLLS